MTIGGPLWGVAVLLMLAVLLVLNVVRLKRSGGLRLPLVTVGAVVVGVLVVVGLVLAFGERP